MWGYQMEGAGDWWYPACPPPGPPAPATWEPGNFTPGPRGRCEPNTGGLNYWYLNRLYSQSCLADALQGLGSSSRGSWPLMGPSLTLILSPPHHLSLYPATTSTPSYLMLARSRGAEESYLIQLWTPSYRVSALGTRGDGLTSWWHCTMGN